ncbi:MAG: hypothetical protein L3V56_10005, partial [Candidatus Magnetoovum sp. WYHC-5]|nr:hypothetical protein [Candidatus Magnetoovum sp. WYHC-5]
MINIKYKLFELFNFLYKVNFPLYRLCYFLYKDISDYKKIQTLEKVLKPGMTVIDIGANIGFYTILLSKLV